MIRHQYLLQLLRRLISSYEPAENEIHRAGQHLEEIKSIKCSRKFFSFRLTVHPAIPDIINVLRCCRHVGLRKAIHIPRNQRILQSLCQRGVKISSTYAKSRHCIEFCERHHDRSAGFIHKNVPIGYIIPHKINKGFIDDEEALFFLYQMENSLEV